MPVVNLTNSFVSKAACPAGKHRVEYCDDVVRGLFLAVTAGSNTATFSLRFKNKERKTAYIKLGRTSEISLADARQLALRHKSEISAGNDPRTAHQAVMLAVPTFEEFFEQKYIVAARERKRSAHKDESLYRTWLKKEFGHLHIDAFERQPVEAFHTRLRVSGLAPATCDHYVKLVRRVLNQAVEWRVIDQNPLARVHLFNVDNRVERYMDELQLTQLLSVLHNDANRPVCRIMLFLLSTGCRLSEALKAKWSQIDELNCVWRIPAANSKGKRLRSVPLNPSALGILKEVRSEDLGEYVFTNKKTGKPYRWVHGCWVRLRNAAGLPHLRIHDLRHQFASFLVNSGRTLYEVQHILGHADPQVTTRYAHLSTASLQAAANAASMIIKEASVGVLQAVG